MNHRVYLDYAAATCWISVKEVMDEYLQVVGAHSTDSDKLTASMLRASKSIGLYQEGREVQKALGEARKLWLVLLVPNPTKLFLHLVQRNPIILLFWVRRWLTNKRASYNYYCGRTCFIFESV